MVSQPWDSVIPATHSGSISIITYQLARRLARSAEVIVYAREDAHLPKAYYDDGVLYRRVSTDIGVWLLRFLERLSWLRHPKRPIFSSVLYHPGYILQIANDLRRRKCDIIHIHQFSQYVPIIRAFNPDSRIVLHMNCEWLSRLDPPMIERRLRQADLIVGCSDYITERIRRAFPQFADRCQTIYNGVDVDCFNKRFGDAAATRNGNKRLLYTGRISPEKGLHTLLDAFRLVLERYPQVELEIAGPEAVPAKELVLGVTDEEDASRLTPFFRGSYLSHLKSKLTPDMVTKVSFTGNIPHSQLVSHYRNADILILPSSIDEPFGIPLVEAMACHMPVIATRGGGMSEIVEEGKTGFLVERGDTDGLAAAIFRLLEREDMQRSMGEAGRQRAVGIFSWDRITEDLLAQYRRLEASRTRTAVEESVVSS